MKIILFVALLAIAATSSLAQGQMKNNQAQPGGNAEQELREMLRKWDEAYSGRNTEALASILADDFLFTNATGTVINKGQYLMGNIKAPDITLAIIIDSADVKVRVYGDTAVVTSRGAQKGQRLNRSPTARYRYTDVWVKQQGRWQAVASQATLILQP
jgi:ketosteroid isomerase-like protein